MQWNTGEGQTVVLGLVFMFVFMAYYMIQGFSANLYAADLGSNMEATLYATFTVFCFLAPPITNKIGTRLALFIGILGYAVLVGCSMGYYLYNASDDDRDDDDEGVGGWVIILGGAINGIGAALLWTAQGRLMLQYSDGGSDSARIFAIFWSIFNVSAVLGGFITFGYFSSSAADANFNLFVIFLILIVAGAAGSLLLKPPHAVVIGRRAGSAPLLQHEYDAEQQWQQRRQTQRRSKGLRDEDGVLDGTYGNGVVGARRNGGGRGSSLDSSGSSPGSRSGSISESVDNIVTSAGQTLLGSDGSDSFDESPYGTETGAIGAPIIATVDANGRSRGARGGHMAANSNGNPSGSSRVAGSGGVDEDDELELSRESWWVEMRDTLRLFGEPRMARMAFIFFYTGFNQPYQLVTFGDRFFTAKTLGLMFSLFYTLELVGAWVSSRILDDSRRSIATRAVRAYVVFFIVTTLGNLFALALEVPLVRHSGSIFPGISEADDDIQKTATKNIVLGALAMAFWGFSDSQIQAIAYWHIGVTYKSGADQARGVGFFKFVQSAGWSIGFVLSPTHRVSAIWQLALTAVCYVIGLFLLQMPSADVATANTAMPSNGKTIKIGQQRHSGKGNSTISDVNASPLIIGERENYGDQLQ